MERGWKLKGTLELTKLHHVQGKSAHVLGMSALTFGLLLIAAGGVAYVVNVTLKPAGWGASTEKPEPAA